MVQLHLWNSVETNPITTLVQVSTGAVPLAGGGTGSAGRALRAARPGGGTGAGGGVAALQQGLARIVRSAHHPGAGGAAEDGTYPTPPVRLGGGGWGAERGDLLARLCGIRRQRPAGAPARRPMGHVSRDSTAIASRRRPSPPRRPGRSAGGVQRWSRSVCDIGVKRNAKGHQAAHRREADGECRKAGAIIDLLQPSGVSAASAIRGDSTVERVNGGSRMSR